MAERPSRAGAVPVHSLLDHLRGELPSRAFSMCFGVAEERGGGVLALPNEFVRGLFARRFDDELRAWAESTGVSRVELVVDASITASGAADGSELADLIADAPNTPTVGFPPGVTTRLLAERGFWSLSPRQRAVSFAVEDLRGSLAVEPSRRGAPGVCEAIVSTALLTLWAGGDRRELAVRVSLRRLCALPDLSRSGKTVAEPRASIEELKTTELPDGVRRRSRRSTPAAPSVATERDVFVGRLSRLQSGVGLGQPDGDAIQRHLVTV